MLYYISCCASNILNPYICKKIKGVNYLMKKKLSVISALIMSIVIIAVSVVPASAVKIQLILILKPIYYIL